MVRKTIPPELRKQPVSVSLTASEIVMLDNLAKAGQTNRSALLAALITGKAYNELGLMALEQHIAPGRAHHGACNPRHIDGRCNHPNCRQIYQELKL